MRELSPAYWRGVPARPTATTATGGTGLHAAQRTIARDEITRVLIDAMAIPETACTTLELVSEHGPEQPGLGPLFVPLPRR